MPPPFAVSPLARLPWMTTPTRCVVPALCNPPPRATAQPPVDRTTLPMMPVFVRVAVLLITPTPPPELMAPNPVVGHGPGAPALSAVPRFAETVESPTERVAERPRVPMPTPLTAPPGASDVLSVITVRETVRDPNRFSTAPSTTPSLWTDPLLFETRALVRVAWLQFTNAEP